MIKEHDERVAVFVGSLAGESVRVERQIIAWGDNGQPLIIGGRCLVAADQFESFSHIE